MGKLIKPHFGGDQKPPNASEEAALYDRYVAEGKAAAKHQWTLGDLAVRVSAMRAHGEAALEGYADEIGVAYATLRGYMATARAWPQIDGRPSISLADVLRTHPDRVAIVERKPGMTCAEARELMRQYWEPSRPVIRTWPAEPGPRPPMIQTRIMTADEVRRLPVPYSRQVEDEDPPVRTSSVSLAKLAAELPGNEVKALFESILAFGKTRQPSDRLADLERLSAESDNPILRNVAEAILRGQQRRPHRLH